MKITKKKGGMRKVIKYTLLIVVVASLWVYVEELKKDKEAAKYIEGMASYEGLYRISYIGDFEKNDKEFNPKFNLIYRKHRDILDGYDGNPNPNAETLDLLDIKKIPIILVLDHKEIIYRAHTLKELDDFLYELEEQ